MSYEQDNGYTPQTFEEIIDELRLAVNAEWGTTYDTDQFIGTGWYRFLYPVAQKIQRQEVKTSEIFTKVAEYIVQKNIKIERPSVSMNGIVDAFLSNGYVASVKPTEEIDIGKIYIAVDLVDTDPDFAVNKLAVCNLIKNYTVAGTVTQGDQVESITLSNGQSFDFKFVLADKNPILFRITLADSLNSSIAIPEDEAIRTSFYSNYIARYRMGWNIEPQKYYNQGDALWAASVLVEYSLDNGDNWLSTIHTADYDELWTLNLEDVSVIYS